MEYEISSSVYPFLSDEREDVEGGREAIESLRASLHFRSRQGEAETAECVGVKS